jgi:exosortase/archaeosortase family protein
MLALSFYLYLLYQGIESFPVGISSVALFAAGLHLSIRNVRFLEPFRRIAPFLVVGATASLALVSFGLDAYLANSYYSQLLALASARLTGLLFALGGVQVHVSNAVLSFPDGQALSIGPLCSGVSSTVLFLLLSFVMVADVGKDASKKRLVVALALGLVGANLANMFRITFLASVMYLFGLGALDVVHQFAGYAVFLGFMAAFWLLSFRWIGRAPQGPA